MGTLDILGYNDHGDFSAPNVMTPQEASQTYKAADEYGTSLQDVTPGMRNAAKEKQVFDGSGEVFQKNMRNPIFKAAVAGDEKPVSTLESIVRNTAGDLSDKGFVATARKSVARGIQGLGQASDVGDLMSLREELDRLRDERDAGNAKEYNRRHAAIEADIARIAQDVARGNRLRDALSSGSPIEKFAQAYAKDGWGGAFSAAWDDLSGFGADLFGEQAVQMAPVVGAAGAATTATAVAFGGIPTAVATAIGAAVTGLASFYQDSRLSIVDRMSEYGLDKTNPSDVAYFFTHHTQYGEAKNAQLRHSAVVGSVDALAFHLGTKMVPKKLGASWHETMPAGAQAFEKFNENVYRYTFANLTAQGMAQSALGAAGEAGGQLAAEGKITDPVSVALEAMGEGMTAPFEAAVAFRATHNRLVKERQVATARKELLTQAVETVRSSAALQNTPELLTAYTEELSQTYGVEAISVDVAALSQSEEGARVVDAMREAVPSLSRQISEAVETGGSVEVPLADYFRVTQDETAASMILDQSSVSGEPSEAAAAQAETSVLDSRKASIARFSRGQSPEFRDSLRRVAEEYGKQLDSAVGATQTEKAAILSLAMAHVSAMARDLGVMPEELWADHGVRAVLGEGDVTRDANGVVTPLSDKAKAVLPGKTQMNPNALGSFLVSKDTIIRWANANKATLLHETGHWFMKARAQIAANYKGRPDLTEAQKNFVLWTERAVQWMGYKDIESFMAASVDERRAGEEKFARTYEQYLKEGNAPSTELQSIFRRFSAWLKKIYGVLTAVRGSELTPEAQEIFDALFVSSEQVREAQLRRSVFLRLEEIKKRGGLDQSDEALRLALNVLMKDVDEAAMEAFYARGTKGLGALRQLRNRIVGGMEKEAEKLRKQYTKEAIESSYSEKRREVMKIIDAGWQVADANGRIMRVRPKFYIKDLKKAGVPKEQIEKLREMDLVSGTNGIHAIVADSFAQLFGYSGVTEMARDLTFDPFNGNNPEDAVRFIVERRMEDEHPELADHETIEASADAAVFNPTESKALLLEINFLQSATKKPATMQLFDAAAEAMIRGKAMLGRRSAGSKALAGERLIRDWRNDAAKLAEEARKRMKEGDLEGAASAKRKQLVRDRMAQQAQNFLDAANRFVRDMRRYDGAKTSQSMQLSYLKQLEVILQRAGLIREAQENTPDYDSFATAERVAAYVPDMPASVRDGKMFADMTFGEATEFMEFVQNFLHAARDRNTVVVRGKKLDAIQTDEKLSDVAEKNAQAHGRKPVKQNANDKDRILSWQHWGRQFFYAHVRLSALFTRIEGKRNGVLFETIGRPIDEAANRADELRMSKTQALLDAYKGIQAWLRDTTKREYPSLNATLTNEQLFALALQIGNDGNFNALIAGSARYVDFRSSQRLWTRDDVLAAVGQGCPRQVLEAAQKAWDICGSLGDELIALEARARNTQVDKVKAVPVKIQTAEGTVELPGGYYPIEYDRYSTSFDGADQYVNGLSGRAPQQRRVSHTGHAIERTAPTGKPIELTMTAGLRALNDTINDVCFREPLMNINKIIGPDTRFRATIQKYYGKEAVQTFTKWMQDIAAGGRVANWSDFLAGIRKNVSIAGLGFNFTTAILQAVGNVQSAALIGGRWMLHGLGEFIRNPREANRLVMQKSSMMRARAQTRFKELNEAYSYTSGGRWERGKNTLAQWAYKPMSFIQIWGVDIPTWLGSYQKNLEAGMKQGLTGRELEDFAVSRADRDVIDAQGSGRASDLSALERDKGLVSLGMVFYNFFGTALNLGVMLGDTEKGARWALKMAMVFVFQQMIEAMIREAIKSATSEREKDPWAKRALFTSAGGIASLPFGMFIGLREFSNNVSSLAQWEKPKPYQGTTGTRPIADIMKAHEKVFAKPIGLASAKAVTDVIGDVSGLPSGQLNKLWETIVAVNDDKIEPYEIPFSLVFGHKEKKD